MELLYLMTIINIIVIVWLKISVNKTVDENDALLNLAKIKEDKEIILFKILNAVEKDLESVLTDGIDEEDKKQIITENYNFLQRIRKTQEEDF